MHFAIACLFRVCKPLIFLFLTHKKYVYNKSYILQSCYSIFECVSSLIYYNKKLFDKMFNAINLNRNYEITKLRFTDEKV